MSDTREDWPIERTPTPIAVRCPQHDNIIATQIELVGRTGKNGKVGRIEQRLTKIEEKQEKQAQFLFKLALAAVASIGSGVGLGSAIAKLIGG